jgi:hypothetical protein
MKRGLVLACMTVFVVGYVLILNPGARGQDEIRIDRKHFRELKTRYVKYGFKPGQTIVQEATSVHFKLPGGVPKITQTGVSSTFVLAGECDASCTYELLDFPAVKTGYGSSVGVAFDAPEDNCWGGIQRAYHPTEGSCYLVMTVLPGDDGKPKESFKAVPTKTTKGRLGIQRVKDELIFLAADSHSAELVELHRFKFTDQTMRGVRFFADPGGSPTPLEARLGDLRVRAEEITGGIPKRDVEGFPWHWPALGVSLLAIAGFVVWRRFKST